jgi:hypothetical protein
MEKSVLLTRERRREFVIGQREKERDCDYSGREGGEYAICQGEKEENVGIVREKGESV